MDFSPSETHLPKFKVETCFLSILLILARACRLGPGTSTLHAEGDDPEESEMEARTFRTHPCENGRLSQRHMQVSEAILTETQKQHRMPTAVSCDAHVRCWVKQSLHWATQDSNWDIIPREVTSKHEPAAPADQ